jgi:hypothetical protein
MRYPPLAILAAAALGVLLGMNSTKEGYEDSVETIVKKVATNLARISANKPAGTTYTIRVVRLRQPGNVRLAIRVNPPGRKSRRAWYKNFKISHDATAAIAASLAQSGATVQHLQANASGKGYTKI